MAPKPALAGGTEDSAAHAAVEIRYGENTGYDYCYIRDMKCALRFMLATVLVAACSADNGSNGATADSSPPEATGTAAATSGNAVPEGIERGATPEVGATDAAVHDPQADATPEGPGTEGIDPERVFVFPRPEHVRGLYVNAWSAGSRRRITALTELARRTEINTFVVDIKDATGYVSHPAEVPLAQRIGATGEIRIPNLRVLLARLEAAGIYPIARIVIVKDPLIAAAHPELAVQDTAGGPWIDDKGIVWLNPYHREVWDYHVAIAREVAAMGFPEIQWDYVRFPDAPASAMRRAYFPGGAGVPRPQAIREFLAYSRAELADMDVQVTADVFGVTTSVNRDVGIGQVWESFIDVVDVALPMVYPSHYWKGSFGYDRPNSYPYEIVREALEDAVRRSAVIEGAGATRPWLQDFTLGPPRYEAPEVRAQIQAAYDVGIEEWILWNPGSRYTEAALEPAGGFVEEPLMRIADQVVPVSRRFEFYDTATVIVEPDSTDSARGRNGNPSGS